VRDRSRRKAIIPLLRQRATAPDDDQERRSAALLFDERVVAKLFAASHPLAATRHRCKRASRSFRWP
jgi:hypothetical protein